MQFIKIQFLENQTFIFDKNNLWSSLLALYHSGAIQEIHQTTRLTMEMARNGIRVKNMNPEPSSIIKEGGLDYYILQYQLLPLLCLLRL